MIMNKKVLIIIAVIIVGLLGALVGGGLWFKAQFNQPAKEANPHLPPSQSTVHKIDLSTQPEWVQKLEVTAVKGQSVNGLQNVSISVKGIPKGLVKTLEYVMQFETTNRGSQGAYSTTPIDLQGAAVWTKTMDLGTCSTYSCVPYKGVKSLDLELDFITTSGDKPAWSKTLDLAS